MFYYRAFCLSGCPIHKFPVLSLFSPPPPPPAPIFKMNECTCSPSPNLGTSHPATKLKLMLQKKERNRYISNFPCSANSCGTTCHRQQRLEGKKLLSLFMECRKHQGNTGFSYSDLMPQIVLEENTCGMIS